MQHHGKEMSYNNYLDADAAYSCCCDFKVSLVHHFFVSHRGGGGHHSALCAQHAAQLFVFLGQHCRSTHMFTQWMQSDYPLAFKPLNSLFGPVDTTAGAHMCDCKSSS